MIPGREWLSVPVAKRLLAALEGVVANLVIVKALGRQVEVELPLQAVGGRKG
jgi:hypothetical protein